MNRPPDEEVLNILKVVRMCQTLNVLPLAGGLFDQDSYFVECYEAVMMADAERTERDSKRK